VARGRRTHAWRPLDPFDQLIDERRARSRRPGSLGGESRDRTVIQIEADIDGEDPHLAPQAQRRDDEQHQRHRDLPDDVGASRVEPCGRAGPAFAESGHDVGARGSQRGNRAAQQGCDEHQEQPWHEEAAIGRDGVAESSQGARQPGLGERQRQQQSGGRSD